MLYLYKFQRFYGEENITQICCEKYIKKQLSVNGNIF